MKRSGIYRLFCTTSGKSYVGQSKNVIERVGKHFWSLSRGCHTNLHLQRSFDLHGHDAFLAEIVEYCNEDALTEREQHWMNHYGADNLYNMCPAAKSSLGIKRSEETKAKIREALNNRSAETKAKISQSARGKTNALGYVHPPEFGEKISKSLKGRKLSDEHRQNLSKAKSGNINGRGNKGHKHSNEARRRMSESMKASRARRKAEKEVKGAAE